MEQPNEFRWDAIIREWLQKLCAMGITEINLGHRPGLWGLRAVTDYLDEVTRNLSYDDYVDSLARQVYMAFFQRDSVESYSKLSDFFLTRETHVHLDPSRRVRAIFNISAYATVDFERCNLPGASDLAEKLADEFAKGCVSKSSKK